MILLNSGRPRAKPSTCLVDLDFQHGLGAVDLDLDLVFNLAEIEPRPDRLDRQLLEVMLVAVPPASPSLLRPTGQPRCVCSIPML